MTSGDLATYQTKIKKRRRPWSGADGPGPVARSQEASDRQIRTGGAQRVGQPIRVAHHHQGQPIDVDQRFVGLRGRLGVVARSAAKLRST